MRRRDSLKAMLGGLAAVLGFSGCGPEEVPGLPPAEPPDEPRVEDAFGNVKLCRFRAIQDSHGGWVVWQMDDPRKTAESAESAV